MRLSTSIFFLLLTTSLLAGERWYSDPNLGCAGCVPLDFHSRESIDWLDYVDVYSIRKSVITKLSNEQLSKLSQQLQDKPVVLDDGSANKSGPYKNSLKQIGRLIEHGFNLQYIAMQSPLSKPKEPAYSNVSSYIDVIIQQYPWLTIGLIDATAAKKGYLEAVEVYSQMDDRIEFVHLDIPAIYPRKKINITYQEVAQLVDFLEQKGLKTGVYLVSPVGGKVSGLESWRYIKHQIKNYTVNEVMPDVYIYDSWYKYPVYSDMSGKVFTLIHDYLSKWGIK